MVLFNSDEKENVENANKTPHLGRRHKEKKSTQGVTHRRHATHTHSIKKDIKKQSEVVDAGTLRLTHCTMPAPDILKGPVLAGLIQGV